MQDCVPSNHGNSEREIRVQSFLYFKTTHGTMKMWSYTVGGLKIKVKLYTKLNFKTKIVGLIMKVVLK